MKREWRPPDPFMKSQQYEIESSGFMRVMALSLGLVHVAQWGGVGGGGVEHRAGGS
jgi:hypothetical protein